MFYIPQSHSSSSRPHMALMAMVLLMSGVLAFLIFLGWQWHFANEDHLLTLTQMSDTLDEKAEQIAAARAAGIRSTTRQAMNDGLNSAAPPTTLVPDMPTPNSGGAATLSDLGRSSEVQEFPDPEPMSKELTLAELEAAQRMQQNFWAATSVEAKLPFVADAERVKPLMHAYYDTQKQKDPVAGDARRQARFRLNGKEVLLFSYAGTRIDGTLDVALITQPDGSFKLDWESYVGASERSWTDLKKDRSTTPVVFRVFAKVDDYYNYEFTDDKRFLCVHLSSPDSFFFVKGYCERTSPVGRSLQSLLATGGDRIALTLRIAFPENAESDHCVNITGIVANRWLIVP